MQKTVGPHREVLKLSFVSSSVLICITRTKPFNPSVHSPETECACLGVPCICLRHMPTSTELPTDLLLLSVPSRDLPHKNHPLLSLFFSLCFSLNHFWASSESLFPLWVTFPSEIYLVPFGRNPILIIVWISEFSLGLRNTLFY